jgi:hypothetical protein
MMLQFIRSMRLQSFLCMGWLLAVLVIFMGTAGNDMNGISYLWAGPGASPAASPSPDPPNPPVQGVQGVQGLRSMLNNYLALGLRAADGQREDSGQSAPLSVPLRALPEPAQAVREQVLRGVRFIEDGRNFSALLELDPAQGDISLHFQKQPPVHLLYVAGVWSYQGQEEYRFSHPLLRKVRIVKEKDRLCLVFYYTDRRWQGRRQPKLSWGDDGLLVAFTKES